MYQDVAKVQPSVIVDDSTMFIGQNVESLTEEERYFNPIYLVVQKGKEYLKKQLVRGSVCDCDTTQANRRIGIFSVAPDKHVSFSQGNLQYFPAAKLWKFADEQYEYLGNANKYLSPIFRNWVDLFGWSADNQTAPFGVSTSTNVADYAGAFVDWGENSICGDAAGIWRTLSAEEWEYLKDKRPNASKLMGIAQVNGINGLIILPDDWKAPEGVTFKSGVAQQFAPEYYKTINDFSLQQWQSMEQNGAVFLPAADVRDGSQIRWLSSETVGSYYLSSTDGNSLAMIVNIRSNVIRTLPEYRNVGRSVRLVQDVQNMVWYTDEAINGIGKRVSEIPARGWVYLHAPGKETTELNRRYVGKRINCIRLRVAREGSFRVSVVNRDDLNTIIHQQVVTLKYLPSKSVQTIILPKTIHLQENQVLVFADPQDTGSFYWSNGESETNGEVNFRAIGPGSDFTPLVKTLRIDAGYHCNKEVCDTLAQTLQLSVTDTTLYTNEPITINTLIDNRVEGNIQWSVSTANCQLSNTSADACTITALKPDTVILTATAVNSPNVRAQCKIIIRNKCQSGVFSVRGDKQVVFAPGNLQYTRSTNTWNFAKEQYEILGKENIKNDTLANRIDLFGWSANNTTAPFGVSTSTDVSDYVGEFVDWGENAICGDAPGTWRTLTKDEWVYLLHNRTDAKQLYSRVQINGVNGLIFLPDDWVCPQGVTFQPSASTYEQQVFTLEQWRKLEAEGAVFFPAAGCRSGSTMNSVNRNGAWWSSSRGTDMDRAYRLGCTYDAISTEAYLYRHDGRSVRLVRDTVVPEFVDLGLSVKWATFNVGAKAPEDYGYYFAWGETEQKSQYNWSNYKWCEGTQYTLTKYCTNADCGKVDNISTIALEDDAAHVHWQEKWRTPTYEEWQELLKQCTWTKMRINGINGYSVTSKVAGYTDKSIFLPDAGYRSGSSCTSGRNYYHYLSSSLYTGEATDIYLLSYQLSSSSLTPYSASTSRSVGQSVRPVYGEMTITTPTIATLAATQITENGALLGGKVTHDGKVSLSEFGVVYSTSEQPTLSDYKVTSTDGYGMYLTQLTDLQVNTTYYARAFATNAAGTAYGSQVSFTTGSMLNEDTTGMENGHAYIDLGLSVMWATCNIGATAPEGYGDYFAWGETTPKNKYDWTTYKWCEGTATTITKYCANAEVGSVDNITILEREDDAATVNWGGRWRTPTSQELSELINQCIWIRTTENGIKGFRVTSKTNGNSIFLPAAGYKSNKTIVSLGSLGYYQSSTLITNYPGAYHYGINYKTSSYVNGQYQNHCNGYPIRPVCNEGQVKKPSVTTYKPSEIYEDSAIISGRLTSDGGGKILEHGVVYGTSKNPTINNGKVISTDGLYMFYSHLKELLPNTTYYVRAFATNSAGTSYGAQYSFQTMSAEVSQPIGMENGYGYVDLGLSVEWATCNIGATAPEEYGDYFAWGETETKKKYEWSNYRWCNPTDTTMTKYCVSLKHGYVDNLVTLETNDDIAAQLGSQWRMPTDEEWEELRTQCTWYWINKNHINGYKIVGKNGNSIFLPVAGYKANKTIYDEGTSGAYWSSSLYVDQSLYAYGIIFNVQSVNRQYNGRFCGLSVRTVHNTNLK